MILCPVCYDGPVIRGYDGLYYSCYCERLSYWSGYGGEDDSPHWQFTYSEDPDGPTLHMGDDGVLYLYKGSRLDEGALVPDDEREAIVLHFIEMTEASEVLES